MLKTKLSPRLQCFFEQLLPGEDVWDLFCDHGYLGLAALEAGIFKRVYFVDRANHLIQSLQQQLASFRPESTGDCLAMPAESIAQVVSGTVVMAGIGGMNMLKILKALLLKSNFQPQRLVLSPQRDEELVARALSQGLIPEAPDIGLVQVLHIQEGPRVRKVFVLNLKNDLRVN